LKVGATFFAPFFRAGIMKLNVLALAINFFRTLWRPRQPEFLPDNDNLVCTPMGQGNRVWKILASFKWLKPFFACNLHSPRFKSWAM
jgi:hypothetical protein